MEHPRLEIGSESADSKYYCFRIAFHYQHSKQELDSSLFLTQMGKLNNVCNYSLIEIFLILHSFFKRSQYSAVWPRKHLLEEMVVEKTAKELELPRQTSSLAAPPTN